MTRSKKLLRQFKKQLGDENAEQQFLTLAQTLGTSALPDSQLYIDMLKRLPEFFEAIDQSYEQFEEKNRLATRNLELSSQELNVKNRQLDELNRSINAMLDSLGEGLCFFGQDGQFSSIYSKACLNLLEADPSQKHIADLLKVSDSQRQLIERWLEMVFLGHAALDFDELSDLAPHEFPHSEGRYIALQYKPMYDHKGALRTILLVATDKTIERRSEHELKRREQQAVQTLRIARNRNFFVRFIMHAREMLEEWNSLSQHQADCLNRLHTLKGVAGTFQFIELTQALHRMEHAVKIGDETEVAHTTNIKDGIAQAVEQAREVLGEHFEESGETRIIEYQKIHHLIGTIRDRFPEAGNEVAELLINELVAQPVADLFDDFAMTLQETADRFGKKLQPCQMSGDNFMLVYEWYRDFFLSLVHIARNIIDHGIEEPALRLQLGKSAAGQVSVHTEQHEREGREWYRFTIADDGGGIDEERLRAKLKQQYSAEAVAAMGYDDLIQHIFGGVSTAQEVTEFSGRGVGLSAVKKAIEEKGGSIRAESELAVGTRFIIELPKVQMV